MRESTHSNRPADVPTARLCAAIFVVGVLSSLSTFAYGAERPNSPQSSGSTDAPSGSSVLEREFWACDYAATTRGVFGTEAYLCGSNIEELKKARFGGDFVAMLEWWQQNKAAEHRALAAQSNKVAGR